MKIKIIEEAGFNSAMRGLSLSYNKDPEEMPEIALKLSKLDKGHNKFQESIQVWLDIQAPRYWWVEFDTYRIGVTKQSEATMHTLKKMELKQENFELEVQQSYINYLNSCIQGNAPLDFIKNALPEGFLQRRIVCTNYKAIRGMILQRKKHKLNEWKMFCEAMKGLQHYRFLGVEDDNKAS